MSQLLAEKKLSDRTTLQLRKYQLDQEGAEILQRPVGSSEIVLVLDTKYSGGATSPRKSWYLNEGIFRKLYDAIKDENDFRRVDYFLDNEIPSDDDTGVNSFLETL